MPDIFDEVEEDLRAERARSLARRYAGAGITAFVLILVGTGAFVYWRQKRIDAANTTADRFVTAAKQADLSARNPSADRRDAAGAEATLSDIAQTASAGYRVLARFRLAALQWDTGEHPKAVATWQAITDDTAATPLLRDLATLTSAQHQVDAGDPAVQKQRLLSLTAPDNPWRPMSEQVIALIDLRTGHQAEGAAIMRRLSADPMAPEGVRGMAADILSTLPPDRAPHSAAAPSAAPPSVARPSANGPSANTPAAPHG